MEESILNDHCLLKQVGIYVENEEVESSSKWKRHQEAFQN